MLNLITQTDNINGNEIANTYISVGALDPKYGAKMISGFSNYGKKNVDVFAPGATGLLYNS